MATPEVEFQDILPYAIQYRATPDSAYHMPVEGQRQRGSKHFLEPGVYQIQLSFTGTESACIWWNPTGNAAIRLICEVPADSTGIPRSSRVVTVQAEEGAYLSVVATPRPNSQENPTSTASVMVFPIPA